MRLCWVYFLACLQYEVEVLENTALVGLYDVLKDADPTEWRFEALLQNAETIARLEGMRSKERRQYAADEFALRTYELAQVGAMENIVKYVFKEITAEEREAFMNFLRRAF